MGEVKKVLNQDNLYGRFLCYVIGENEIYLVLNLFKYMIINQYNYKNRMYEYFFV